MLKYNIRSIIFWCVDFISGQKIRKRSKELKRIMIGKKGNPIALKQLLEYAIENVPAYADIDEPQIKRFPVVSKINYQKEFQLYRSKLYQNEHLLHKVFTSGSTGTPFMAYQDKEKIFWHQAGLININNSIGWGLGEKFMFFRVWGIAHDKCKLSQIKSNIIAIDVMNLTDVRKQKICEKIINEKKLHLIIGYASALSDLAGYIIEKKYKAEELGIKIVIADSDKLSINSKKKIEKAFGCVVLDRYGNNENGIIAITMPNDDRMHINFPEYYVEVLKIDSDEPAEVGECGRVVITDIYNKAFPFIRYDTGDLGVVSEKYEDQCMILEELTGRISGVLKTVNGSLVGEATITSFFENLMGIGRYQIIQKTKFQYEILLQNTNSCLDNELTRRAKKCFGDEAEIVVRHVEKIKQENNGKYKITINEC